MINGLPHRDIILNILQDGKPHFAREFLSAGLCEYRQPIDQLRKRGYIVEPLTIEDRPAWILKGRKEFQKTFDVVGM